MSNLVVVKKWDPNTVAQDYLNNKMKSNLVLDYNESLTPVDRDLAVSEKIYQIRQAAEVHRIVRREVQETIKPKMKIYDICTNIENTIRKLTSNDLTFGIGFPVGFSINDCAAHDSASVNDNRILKYDDVVKIDFGTHRNGYIIDSAFTCAFNPRYENLLLAAKDGLWAGIKTLGVDTYINDISEAIQEAIESYEIELDGKTYPILSSKVMGGHNIGQYNIHDGQLILGIPQKDYNERINADSFYAVELFPTTGNGIMKIDDNAQTNLYALRKDAPFVNFKFKISNQMLGHIKKKYGTLPFCTRWLYDQFGSQYKIGLQEIMGKGLFHGYPPIIDKKNSYSAQFEHTLYTHELGKEILSYGEDY